jgi:mono/diheme cytochrome c family protein
MKRLLRISGTLASLVAAGCAHKSAPAPAAHPAAFGTAIVESSGGKQLGTPGAMLPQPLVVQVNDAQGNAVTGALVAFSGPNDVNYDPAGGLTDSSGQLGTSVTLGGVSGRYRMTAASADKSGKPFTLSVTETALGYQEQVGYEVDQSDCARCHDQESSAERVSNYDNLAVKPHAFTDGQAQNALSDADLTAIITHGGPALNRSALMPPYGATLSKAEVQAVIAYIRLVSDPPWRASGMVYAKR